MIILTNVMLILPKNSKCHRLYPKILVTKITITIIMILTHSTRRNNKRITVKMMMFMVVVTIILVLTMKP